MNDLMRNILSDLRVEKCSTSSAKTSPARRSSTSPGRRGKWIRDGGTLLVVSGAMRRSCGVPPPAAPSTSPRALLQHPQPRRKSARYPGNAPLLLGDVLPQRPAEGLPVNGPTTKAVPPPITAPWPRLRKRSSTSPSVGRRRPSRRRTHRPRYLRTERARMGGEKHRPENSPK